MDINQPPTIKHYSWYPVAEAWRIPVEETGTDRPMITVIDTHANLILFTPEFGGAEPGF